MISVVNRKVWEACEESLTPLGPNSTNWRIFYHLPAALYFPLGLGTLGLDSIAKILSYAASFFAWNNCDPNKDFTSVLDNPKKWGAIKNLNVQFDQNFLFGTATCTWQDSGAANCPDSQWSDWEKKVVPEDNRSGQSANLWNLYQTPQGRKQIIDRLKKLEVNSYRFSVEMGHDLNVYRNLCRDLHRCGIKPLPTLHHFSESKAFHQKGSFENEENIEEFVVFAEKVYWALNVRDLWGNRIITHICTINEPGIEAFSRYIRGAFSPGHYFRFDRAGRFLKGTLKAHCAVYKKLKELNPNLQVGIVHQRLKMNTSNPLITPILRYINRLVNDTALHFFITGEFLYKIPFASHIHEKMEEMPKTDFVGLQYYVRPNIPFDFRPKTLMPFSEDPEGIYEAILEVYDAFKVPIIITENGISTNDPKQRRRYFERALYAIDQASQKIGAKNLRGYFVWSFCANAEWDMGKRPQAFGIYDLKPNGELCESPKKGMEPFIWTALRSREVDAADELSTKIAQ